MKKNKQRYLYSSFILLVGFVVWTTLVKYVDVGAIGPDGSSVGFAKLNAFIHRLTGVKMILYIITDWLSIIPFVFAIGFGIFGFIQLIKRKKIQYVDYSILVLGAFYIVVFGLYLLFEVCVVNYRPILIEGILEPSYPSSTTLLVLSIMPTAIMQFNSRIKNITINRLVSWGIIIFTSFMVVGRGISGVHWITDILGGLLLSSGLVTLYYFIAFINKK